MCLESGPQFPCGAPGAIKFPRDLYVKQILLSWLNFQISWLDSTLSKSIIHACLGERLVLLPTESRDVMTIPF